jgi:transcriptional regulator with XRE-family HTH domain
MVFLHGMISQRKTTVSVLRAELGLSVEEFAKLIGKSVSTVTKLDNGQLKLSEETAFKIAQETGVEMSWLLEAKPKEKPYCLDGWNRRQTYTKEIFELTQAQKKKGAQPTDEDPSHHLIGAIALSADWISVYTKAAQADRSELAAYLMRQFLNQLVERLGKDDDAVLKLNKYATIVAANGSEWKFSRESYLNDVAISDGPVSLTLEQTKAPR